MPTNKNHLLVEDIDTQGVVIGLMRHHINWPTHSEGWPAKIESKGGVEVVLSKELLGVKIKESDSVALGLIVDANTDFGARWGTIRDVCHHLGASPPVHCPKEGLILDIGAKRLGVWIMPNNASRGMLEDFCHTLVPDTSSPLWVFARECVDGARQYGADYKDVHVEKAHIHTWLAWRDAPGERMGTAITRRILENGTPAALSFVAWFRKLFNV